MIKSGKKHRKFLMIFLFTDETLKPNLKKINPVEGLKRMFSLKALMEGLKAVIKFSTPSVAF